MTQIQTDYLKDDEVKFGQKYALISMVHPRNHELLKNREAFFAANFLQKYVQEHDKARDFEEKNGQDEMTDLQKEYLDLSYENIQNLYYDFQKYNSKELEKVFNEKYNDKNEIVVTGFKIRGVYPDNESLQADIQRFHAFEPSVDIYTAPVGKWVPYCPVSVDGVDVKYAEEKLNSILGQQHKEMQQRKQEFENKLM